MVKCLGTHFRLDFNLPGPWEWLELTIAKTSTFIVQSRGLDYVTIDKDTMNTSTC